MFKRKAIVDLEKWADSKWRKPLILRGARQVGKTTAVKQFAQQYDNFLSFINAASDTLLFTQNFCTLAEAAGLGTCYLGTTVYNPQGIIDVLQLPRLTFPIATITVGYPDEMPEQPDRLPIDGIVHEETYHDYAPTDIDRIYALKESLEENRHFVEVNGKETLAQVFTDCRYTRNDNEQLSAGMLAALRHQGFLDSSSI